MNTLDYMSPLAVRESVIFGNAVAASLRGDSGETRFRFPSTVKDALERFGRLRAAEVAITLATGKPTIEDGHRYVRKVENDRMTYVNKMIYA